MRVSKYARRTPDVLQMYVCVYSACVSYHWDASHILSCVFVCLYDCMKNMQVCVCYIHVTLEKLEKHRTHYPRVIHTNTYMHISDRTYVHSHMHA
jgi:hypothetical protein